MIISQLHGKAIALPCSATQQCRDTVINLSYACQWWKNSNGDVNGNGGGGWDVNGTNGNLLLIW